MSHSDHRLPLRHWSMWRCDRVDVGGRVTNTALTLCRRSAVVCQSEVQHRRTGGSEREQYLTRATLPWDAINRRSTEHPTTNLRCTKVSADSENDFRAQDRTCKNLAYYYRSFDLYLLDTPILYCTFLILLCFVSLFKSPLAIATAALRDGHVHIFVCPFVCLSPKCAQKRYFLQKN